MRHIFDFIECADSDDCDPHTRAALLEAITDIFACTIAGAQAPISRMTRTFAAAQYGRGDCTVFLSPDRMTAAGAALVNGAVANALDIDDGHRLTKGHPGAAIFPAILAAAEYCNVGGKPFMDAMLVGYEVAVRAGILAHRLRPDYHCTGSWGALGAAAGVSRLLHLPRPKIEHALGIAEYYAPYSPMMRCIDVPSMVKDGIGWGSLAGLSSALLAEEGFTGIPSLFALEEAADVAADIGTRYRVHELYYKPYACCRWAQPAIEAFKTVEKERRIHRDQIDAITIHTFAESARLMQTYPENTEEAQYNLFFPLAAYLWCGDVGPEQVLHELGNPDIRRLMDRMTVQVDPAIDEQFPAQALSRVDIRLRSGERIRSEAAQAKGDHTYPLTSEEKRAKFFRLTGPVLGEARSGRVYDQLLRLRELPAVRDLTALLQPMAAGATFHPQTGAKI